MAITIVLLSELPVDGLSELIEESERSGFRLVRRLVDEWRAGSNRFDRAGEILLAATLDARLLGVCGLNVDPYAADDRIGRVRHLYVLASWRRHGVGGQLVEEIIRRATGHFDVLRLRTQNPQAAGFYERLGFRRAFDDQFATHVMDISAVAQ